MDNFRTFWVCMVCRKIVIRKSGDLKFCSCGGSAYFPWRAIYGGSSKSFYDYWYLLKGIVRQIKGY